MSPLRRSARGERIGMRSLLWSGSLLYCSMVSFSSHFQPGQGRELTSALPLRVPHKPSLGNLLLTSVPSPRTRYSDACC